MDDDEGCKMKSPPSLGLATINIAPFRGMTDLYQSTCLEFRYGDGKVLGTQPHLTCGSASTHCVPILDLIKGKFNMLF